MQNFVGRSYSVIIEIHYVLVDCSYGYSIIMVVEQEIITPLCQVRYYLTQRSLLHRRYTSTKYEIFMCLKSF